jgi:hypothetical protein
MCSKQGSLRFDLYKFWNKQVPFALLSKMKPRLKLRLAFVSILLPLLAAPHYQVIFTTVPLKNEI